MSVVHVVPSSETQSNTLIRLFELAIAVHSLQRQQVTPDDHSEVVPLLPIPNRTVKRLCANDSADSRVKVGHRQANNVSKAPGLYRALSSLKCVIRDYTL